MLATYILVFLFGASIGSFLNVVIYRYNTGMTLGGRSVCLRCGKQLNVIDLIPLLSFFFLRGRCRGCKSRISFQYPTVEFITGLLFLLVFIKYFGPEYTNLIPIVFYFIISALLVVIGTYDYKHKVIPTLIVWIFNSLAFISALKVLFYFGDGFFETAGLHLHHIPNIIKLIMWIVVSGPIVALPLFIIWALSLGKWMGFGDVVLAIGIGYLLGISAGFTALILSFWVGALVGIVMLMLKVKFVTIKSEIPFAPFLIIGLLIVLLGGVTFTDILNLFSFIK